MTTLGKRHLGVAAIIALLGYVAFKQLDHQHHQQQQHVDWVKWLVSSNGQLHFFDLLELFHRPDKDNHF